MNPAHREAPTLLRRKPRLLSSVALAIALLLAQAGALLHASSHVDEPRDRSGIHAQLCVQCLSFSSVLSGASAPSAPLVLPAVVVALLASAGLLAPAGRSTPRAFRSRAPPRLG